jgi:secondary thiamine-phosphate synthase enzyme
VSSVGYESIEITTTKRLELIDVTATLESCVERSGIRRGMAIAFSPHTTAGVTINEGADPDVRSDLGRFLESLVPRDWGFEHAEGNSDSHVMTSLVGSSVSIIVEAGKLVLGTWQHVFFCEFDGPRRRKLYVKMMSG